MFTHRGRVLEEDPSLCQFKEADSFILPMAILNGA